MMLQRTPELLEADARVVGEALLDSHLRRVLRPPAPERPGREDTAQVRELCLVLPLHVLARERLFEGGHHQRRAAEVGHVLPALRIVPVGSYVGEGEERFELLVAEGSRRVQ